MESVLLDVAGHRRSPATVPSYRCGRPPRNKGEPYPADPPTVEEIVAVVRTISAGAFPTTVGNRRMTSERSAGAPRKATWTDPAAPCSRERRWCRSESWRI
jgi:hypothetical protein